MIETAAPFDPANPIEAAVRAGELAGVAAALRPLAAPQRAAVRAGLRTLEEALSEAYRSNDAALLQWWGGRPTVEQLRCAGAAMVFCGTPADQAEHWLWDDALFPYLDLLDPAELRRLADGLMRSSPSWIHSVQKLVVAGLSERPEGDHYIMGLICAPRNHRPSAMPPLAMLEADPGLLEGPVMRLFEVEGTGEINMSALEKYNHEPDNNWSDALLEMARRGLLARSALLDATLGTLEKDWPQFRAGWFSRFHAALAPLPAEMAPFAARYAGLCQSRIAPTVTLALAALADLFKAGHLQVDLVLGALEAVMSSAVKGQLDGAFKLLDAVVKQQPASAHAAAALAQRALAHASAEIHKKAIARLSAWGFDDATRAALADALPHVSAANRPALAALLGVAAAAPAPAPQLAQAHAGAIVLPLDPGRALAPLAGVDEVVQAVAQVLENDDDVDLFERALDGVVRLLPLGADARERLQPVLKRARKLLESLRHHNSPLGASLARFLLAGAGTPAAVPGAQGHSPSAELARRIDDLIAFAARHPGVPGLCTPTHRGGLIAPAALVARVADHLGRGAGSSVDEQARSLLRLDSGEWPEARSGARALPDSAFTQALRYALGDDVPVGADAALFCAAARIRHPGRDDARVAAAFAHAGPDGARAARYAWAVEEEALDGFTYRHLVMRVTPAPGPGDLAFIAAHRHQEGYWQGGMGELLYGASLLPSNLDAFFASGAARIADNLDWGEASWEHKAYLLPLLDAATPVSPVAAAMLAFALGGKEPGQCALAVDVLVALVLEGRFDAALLAGDMRAMLLAGYARAGRYAASLARAAQADPAMPQAVCALLCGVIAFGPHAPPRETAALLELLLELSLGHGLALAPRMAGVLAGLKLSGKGKAAQTALLAHLG